MNAWQSWPMTGLKPDGGPECTGIFRSRPAFDVDNAPDVSFRCRHSPWVVPIHFGREFEATGVKRSSGAAEFQLQLAVIEISAGVSRKSTQKAANRMQLDTLCNRQAATVATTTRSGVFRCISADDPSGALDVILNIDRHDFYLI